jgi:hypothetical protein
MTTKPGRELAHLTYIKLIDNNIGCRPDGWQENLYLIATAADRALAAGEITEAGQVEIRHALAHATNVLENQT